MVSVFCLNTSFSQFLIYSIIFFKYFSNKGNTSSSKGNTSSSLASDTSFSLGNFKIMYLGELFFKYNS